MYKKLSSFLLSVFLVTGFFMNLTIREAHAYIDIGSGTLMLQALLASLFGSIFALKMFWRRIVDNVNRLLSKDKGPTPPSE